MNYYLPPEWAKQSAILLTWPHAQTIWADRLDAIDSVFVSVASTISQSQSILITCVNAAHEKHIADLLKLARADLSQIYFYQTMSDDIWVRDHGPITVLNQQQPLLLDFIFNGWGNKYFAENDNALTRSLHASGGFKKTPLQSINLVLEGGAIEVDGAGTLLTTKKCILERNPEYSLTRIEQQLKNLFGVKKILWLDYGYLQGDDTDGHIDTLARFVNENTLVYVECDDANDPHFAALQKMAVQLRALTNAQNKPYQLIALPWPKACYAALDGRRLPATYANFLITNQVVLVPTYNQTSDHLALEILTNCFPQHKVIGIACLPLIQWNGSLHCMTMQLPHGVI